MRAMVLAKAPEKNRANPVSRTKKADTAKSLSSPVDHILRLQRTVGNQAVQKLFRSGLIQAKLKIGQPGDIYEQEADRLADAVMCISEPNITKGAKAQLKRQSKYEGEEKTIHTAHRMGQTPEVSSNLESRINAIRGSGQPLPENIRSFFESYFIHDLSNVRIHTDNRAAEITKELDAKAFTIGRDIMFGAGKYAPETASGKYLLAHELTHTIQQGYTGCILQLDEKEENAEKKEEATKEEAVSGKEVFKGCGEWEDAQLVFTKTWSPGPIELEIRFYTKFPCCAYIGGRAIFFKLPKERPPLRKSFRWEIKGPITEVRAVIQHNLFSKSCPSFKISPSGKIVWLEGKASFSLYTLLLSKRGIEFLDKYPRLRDALRVLDPEVSVVGNLSSQITKAEGKDKLIRVDLAFTIYISTEIKIPSGYKLSIRYSKTCVIGFIEIGIDRDGEFSVSKELLVGDCIDRLRDTIRSILPDKIQVTGKPKLPLETPETPLPGQQEPELRLPIEQWVL